MIKEFVIYKSKKKFFRLNFSIAQKLKETKNISVDDILTQLDGFDIDLSHFTRADDENEDDDLKYILKPNKSSSNSELGFSDTDEPDTIPSTSSSSLAKQLKEKKRNH